MFVARVSMVARTTDARGDRVGVAETAIDAVKIVAVTGLAR